MLKSKKAKWIFTLVLLVGLFSTLTLQASATPYLTQGSYHFFRGRVNSSYVLNIYKSGAPVHGDAVRAYVYDGTGNQNWIILDNYTLGCTFLTSANNSNIALSCATNERAVVENLNQSVYGIAQQHDISYVASANNKSYYKIINKMNQKGLTLTDNVNGGIINYQTYVGYNTQLWDHS